MTPGVDLVQSASPVLQRGRCRFVASKNSSQTRRRRLSRAKDDHKLFSGSILLVVDRGGDAICHVCRTEGETSFKASVNHTLCYDDSVRLLSLKSFESIGPQELLSILDPYLDAERFTASNNDASICDCPDLSHPHLCLTGPSELWNDVSVASFAVKATPLLSMTVVWSNDEKVTLSPLEQACMKRRVVSSRVVYVQERLTTEFLVPFQSCDLSLRVDAVMSGPPHSRSVSCMSTQYFDQLYNRYLMPSNQIFSG